MKSRRALLALGNGSVPGLSDAIAFRAAFEGEPPPPAQRYWRGPVLTEFDGRVWRPARFAIAERPDYTTEGPEYAYRLTLEPHNQRWLVALDFPAADLGWLTGLLAPGIIRGNKRRYGQLDLDAAVLARWDVEVVAAEIRSAGRRLDCVRVHDDEREMRGSRRRLVEPELLLLDVGARRPLDEREPRRRTEGVQHHVPRAAGTCALDDLGNDHGRTARRDRLAHLRQHDARRIDDCNLALDRQIGLTEQPRPDQRLEPVLPGPRSRWPAATGVLFEA